jgi:hypothetical protein
MRLAQHRGRATYLAVGTVLIVLIAVVALRGSRVTSSIARSGSGLQSQIVAPGDLVKGVGSIVAAPGVSPLLCVAGTWLQGGSNPLTCSDDQVPLEGLNTDELPDRQVVARVVFSLGAVVTGRWTGSQIVVTHVSRSPEQVQTSPTAPCDAPNGGWPAATSLLDLESAVRRLAAEVAANPTVYRSYYVAKATTGDEVEVVEVYGDPGAARDRLVALFPYGLCIVEVPRSVAVDPQRLDYVANQFNARRGWRAEVDAQRGQVRVYLPMLDRLAVDILATYPEASPIPLIAKA